MEVKAYIQVPSNEINEVEKVGGLFDEVEGKWHVPRHLPISLFNRWIPLTIELVPSSSFYDNLRSILPECGWDTIRKDTYKGAKYTCEVCGGRGDQYPVECHEVWGYDDINLIQKLKRCISLCPMCHKVKHIGKASVDGYYQHALEHLCKVNGWHMEVAEVYVEESLYIWEQRSHFNWQIDLAWIETTYECKLPVML